MTKLEMQQIIQTATSDDIIHKIIIKTIGEICEKCDKTTSASETKKDQK